MSRRSLSICITGSGGSGAVTTGHILLEAMARAGYYGFMSRSAGPQIRGGESAAMLRFSTRPVFNHGDRFDVLLAFDWKRIDRFIEEINLDRETLILTDSDATDLPDAIAQTGASLEAFALNKTATPIEHGRANMVSLGLLANLLSLSADLLIQAVDSILGKKGTAATSAARQCIEQGMLLTSESNLPLDQAATRDDQGLWNISGNEACGLGALKAGVEFVAAYPITPASEILEWLATRLEQRGGQLIQAEDELASINMIIGASFGGVPALTATSGPGLSLMMEGLGLAVASETPITVIDVMRGGPSTGIPTKSEQSDLNLALYGLHGEAPHLVLAPLNIADCAFTTQWAVCLAEQLQAVSIVLSDQSLGQSRLIIDQPSNAHVKCERRISTSPDPGYQRYHLTRDGISPMSIPGTPIGMYTADGLEHDEQGLPSSTAADHAMQLNKRRDKLARHDYGDYWSAIEGDGETAIITWGSTSPACFEAGARLNSSGRSTRVIALRLLMPLNTAALQQRLSVCNSILVVEQNQTGQLYHYLMSEGAIPHSSHHLSRPGPLPIRPGEIVAMVEEYNANNC